jgi:hypothetical protein
VKGRGDNLHVIKSGGAEMVRDPARAAFDIGLVLALGADAGDAQKFAELRQVLVARRVNQVSKVHMGSSGDLSPFQYEYAKLGAKVCGSRMNVELRMTCRGRASILEPQLL